MSEKKAAGVGVGREEPSDVFCGLCSSCGSFGCCDGQCIDPKHPACMYPETYRVPTPDSEAHEPEERDG